MSLLMSRHRNDYCLFFSGLGEGGHDFEYVLDQRLMEEFPGEEDFCRPEVGVKLHLEKGERMMELSFSFEGKAVTRCDRCLREISFPVRLQETVIVKTVSSAGKEEEEDGIWQIGENESFLDLAAYFHEVLVLSRPLQCVCPPGQDGEPDCDAAMLALYSKGGQAEGEKEPDPRWAVLENLRGKMSG